jgi:hypothetical protein
MAFVLTDTRSATTRQRFGKTELQRFATRAALALVTALILLPPRWLNHSPGAVPLPDDVGYVRAVDEMAMLGLFRVEEEPRAKQPPLRMVQTNWSSEAIDSAAFADCRTRLERLPFSPWFTGNKQGQCRARFLKYLKNSYLEYDMRRIQQWRLESHSVLGLMPNAHMLAGAGAPTPAGLAKYATAVCLPEPSRTGIIPRKSCG